MSKYDELRSQLDSAMTQAPAYEKRCREEFDRAMTDLRTALGWPERDFSYTAEHVLDGDGRLPFTMTFLLRPMQVDPATPVRPFDVEFTACVFWLDDTGARRAKLGANGRVLEVGPFPQGHVPQYALAGGVLSHLQEQIRIRHRAHG